MGIYIIFSILPAWLRAVLWLIPGLAGPLGSLWFGDSGTDFTIDDLLVR